MRNAECRSNVQELSILGLGMWIPDCKIWRKVQRFAMLNFGKRFSERGWKAGGKAVKPGDNCDGIRT